MIGSVDLGVAVAARAVHHEEADILTRKALVSARLVAVLTQARSLANQQVRVIRSMRVVAIETVLLDGRMLPQNRGLHFGVALVALLVDGIRRDQLLRLATVWIMATGTTHLA